MAFSSSDWNPLWKGFGLDAEEELPTPDSFGSEFDNSLKKRVSFSEPVLSTDDSNIRKKKQAWKNWRRKSDRSKSSKHMPIVTEKYPDEPCDSFESFEAKAMEHRDEHLDGDFWDESDERDSDSKEDEAGPNLWSMLFGFRDDEKDFDDGWTEGGSTFFSDNGTEGASTFFSDAETSLNSSFSEELKRSDSHDLTNNPKEKGEEVKLVEEFTKISTMASQPTTSAKKLHQEQRDGVSRSTSPAEADKKHSAATRSCIIPVKVNQEADKELIKTFTDKRHPDAESEVLDKPIKPPDERKTKKKARWLIGRGRGDKKGKPRNTVESSSSLVPEEKQEAARPTRTTSYAVDKGESGIGHKSCVPVLFAERKPKEPIGNLLCQSQRPSCFANHSSVSVNSDLASTATSVATEQVPVVRIVSDFQGNQGSVVATRKGCQSDVHRQMQLQESHFATASGPQSIYSYEYGSQQHMVVRYKKFGGDPEEVLSVREYEFPMTVFPGSDDVVVMVEASTISLSDCRIRQGEWWGQNPSPLPNTPGVDLVGKIQSVDPKTTKKYKFKSGDRVMSLVRWGGNARYSRIKASQLVRVPRGVDPAEAACLAEAYLSAFQALQYSQSSWARYSSQSLIGKSVLVIGGMTNVGHAVIELAVALGAMDVYATGKPRHQSNLKKFGATPIDRKPKLWPSKILGMIDLVIDATGDVSGEHANVSHFNALHEQGVLVFIGLRDMTDAVAREWDVTSSLLEVDNTDDLVNRTHSLEVFDNWDFDLDLCKNDLDFLLRLLEQEMIKPVVRDVLPLAKVARAQRLLESKRVDGYLVCEPWIKSKNRAVYL